jgi:Ca-activated chloride channel family protein
MSSEQNQPKRRWLSATITTALAVPIVVGGIVVMTRPDTARAVAPEPQTPQTGGEAAHPPVRPPIHPPIRPPRPLPPPRPFPVNAVKVKSVTVNTTIRDGVAETEVSHIFQNMSGAPQEGDFVFPIPAGASVSSFAMYDGEKKLEARLLEADEATRTYEEIVRARRDPALLTFQGRAALRARVFPIAPHGERRLTLKLVTVLPREGDARKYAWTLVGPYLPSQQRPESVSVHVTLTGSQPVGNVYSPTHPVRIRRDSENKVVAMWDMGNGATLAENPDFDLYVTPGRGGNVALSALTYNAALPQVASLTGGARQSGYFLVVASPTIVNAEKNALPRRVVLVMDRSGSMQGKKIEQAKSALRFALGKLRPQDSFNIVTFSDRVEEFAPEPVAASADNKKRAEAFVDDIVADGGTNINDALQKGLKMFPEKGSGNTLLFFTDGLPTVGVRSQEQIVQNANAINGRKARCFVFGVGYDVDVPFLDEVAETLRGDADYVRPDEDIEVKTSTFVAKTSAPVLENLKVTVDGAKTGEIYPKPENLPDLFAGSQLVLVGRYTGGANNVKITLTGEANGKPQTYAMNAAFPGVDTSSDFLPRLWASRKIGYLMDEVRLRKEPDVKKEIVDQIIALSREYGVLTPYTALFVPEPGTGDGVANRMLMEQESFGRTSGARGGFGGAAGPGNVPAASAPVTVYDYAKQSAGVRAGEAAVNNSNASRAQKSQAQVGNVYSISGKVGAERKKDEDLAKRIKNASNRAFYQVGPVWQDATYDAKKQKELVKVKLYSPAYFALTRRNAQLAKWAAVGENVIIAANATQAIQFSNEGKENLTEKEIDQLAGPAKK